MTAIVPNTPAPTPSTASSPLFATARIVSVLIVILTITMAVLAGLALRAGMPDMRVGHRHLGTLLFGIVVIQTIVSFVQLNKRQIAMGAMLASFALLVITVAQAGLGWAGTNNPELWAYHLPLGVVMMMAATVVLMFAWRPAPTRHLPHVGAPDHTDNHR